MRVGTFQMLRNILSFLLRPTATGIFPNNFSNALEPLTRINISHEPISIPSIRSKKHITVNDSSDGYGSNLDILRQLFGKIDHIIQPLVKS